MLSMSPQPTPTAILTEDDAVAAVGSSSPYRRREAIESLGILGVRPDLLFNALEDHNPWVRGAIAVAARRMPPSEAAGLVSVLINDRNPNVVVDALETIATLELTQFSDQVLVATSSADHRVRAGAIRALGFIDPERADTVVTEALADKPAKVRVRAAEVARARGVQHLVGPLADALTVELAEDEPHENLVAALCQALVACDHNGSSGPALLAAVPRVVKLQAVLCKSLAKMGYEPARAVFTDLAQAPDAETRALGVRSLGTLGVGESWGLVLAAADDPEPGVRLAALRALGENAEGEANTLDVIRTAGRLALSALELLGDLTRCTDLPAPLAAQAAQARAACLAAATETEHDSNPETDASPS